MTATVSLRPGGTSPLAFDDETLVFDGDQMTNTPDAVHDTTVTIATTGTTVIVKEV